MSRLSLLCFLFLLGTCARAQSEIRWTVNLNTDQIRQADKRIFNSLESDLITFLNNQTWTDDRFEEDERIEATLFLTVEEVFTQSDENETVQALVPDAYTATMALQSLRPVYMSGNKTPVLNTLDGQINFIYRQGEGIQYSERTYLSDLGQILAYYSYIIVGLDYDTFSPLGGEPYFRKALELYNNLPTEVSTNTTNGWKANARKQNRYDLLENITSPRMLPLRRAYYTYHRLGLDVMADNVVEGRNNVTLAIEDVQKANQAYPKTLYVQAFVDAKREEIIEIYKGASGIEQNTVIQAMTRIDPSKSSQYRNIRYRAAPSRRPGTSRAVQRPGKF